MPQFGGASEKCVVCAKSVYLAEKIVVEDKDEKKTFHKTCLRCTHCKSTLSLGNYASMNGVFYCKPHFKQLFATKGNYDEGFGKEKHTTKWTATATPAASSAGSFVPIEKTDEPKPVAVREKAMTSSTDSPTSRFGGGVEKCEKCSKSVYATEKIVIEEKDGKKVYHKTCLRCAHCQNLLTLGNYASMNGVTYCKPHFKQLFAAKGNYDEGFGKEKHTTKWEAQSSGAPATFVPVESTETHKDNKPAVSEVASRFKGMSATDKCNVCGKSVYQTERLVVEDKEDKKVFHKSCLRCSHCQVILSLGNYASMKGIFYCKPHFKQLFASKGNYDEGFGNQKHSAKWLEQGEQPRDEIASPAHEEIPARFEEPAHNVVEREPSTHLEDPAAVPQEEPSHAEPAASYQEPAPEESYGSKDHVHHEQAYPAPDNEGEERKEEEERREEKGEEEEAHHHHQVAEHDDGGDREEPEANE